MEYSSADSVVSRICAGEAFVVLLSSKNYPIYEADAVQKINDDLSNRGLSDIPIVMVDSEEIHSQKTLILRSFARLPNVSGYVILRKSSEAERDEDVCIPDGGSIIDGEFVSLGAKYLATPFSQTLKSFLSRNAITITFIVLAATVHILNPTLLPDVLDALGVYGIYNIGLFLFSISIVAFSGANEPGAGSMITGVILGAIGFYIFALVIGNGLIFLFS